MSIPTIEEIKVKTMDKSLYFFSKGTLQFFNQTLKSFKIKVSPLGRVFIVAGSKWHGRLMGYTFREFRDDDLHMIPEVNCHSLESINSYIESN